MVDSTLEVRIRRCIGAEDRKVGAAHSSLLVRVLAGVNGIVFVKR